MKRSLACLIVFCTSLVAQGESPPTWALGPSPTLTGIITDWAEGDGIAPGEGEMQGVSSLGDMDVQLGAGRVAADGSFTFTLEPEASAASGGVPVAELFCARMTVSDPQARVADVPGVLVPELIVAGEHERPLSTVSLLKGSLQEPEAGFFFYYASADTTISGSCENEYLGNIHYELELKAGWNTAMLDYADASVTTQPLTDEVRWQLMNPLTW